MLEGYNEGVLVPISFAKEIPWLVIDTSEDLFAKSNCSASD